MFRFCPHKSSRLSLCSRPRRRYRQSAVAISSRHRTLPFRLLSAQTVGSEHSIIDSGCGEDFSPGISSRADSTIVIRSCAAYPTTCCEKFNPYRMRHTSNYWKPAVRTHHSSLTEVALASCSSKRRVQARVPSSPVVGWTDTVVPSFDIQLTADTGRPQLRSASERIFVVPRTHSSFGDRSFSAAGPRVWNALPSHLRRDMNYRHFKHALKGHMFKL